MKMEFTIETELKQQLTGAQLQSLSILTMDMVELDTFLQEEYLENPLLESVYEHQQSFRSAEDDSAQQLIPAPEEGAVQNGLLWQLNQNRYSGAEWSLMGYLIDCMDDNGYFTLPPEQIAKTCGVAVETVESCLCDLRELEPCGIMAENLRQCLLKQLEKAGHRGTPVWNITDRFLTEAAEGKISVISRSLGLTTAQVRKCLEQIRQLNPRPLLKAGHERSTYVMPDVILRLEEDVWQIDFQDGWTENYRMNDYYLSMMQETKDEELLAYFKQKLERIRFIQQSIEQRRSTILRIVERAVERQNGYFRGNAALTPMTIQEVAKEVGVHPSTAGRAIHGKYIQYPFGTVLMKDLFSKGLEGNAGSDKQVTPMEVKQTIRKLVESEDPKRPYSDQKLTELMKSDGISVSRRVVAKYREELGIAGSYLRKRD